MAKDIVYVIHLWLGWAYFSTKVPVSWHQGVCFNLPMFFVLDLHQKYQGIAKDARAVLTYAQSYTQKTFFGAPR
jgi:hypothetical protein